MVVATAIFPEYEVNTEYKLTNTYRYVESEEKEDTGVKETGIIETRIPDAMLKAAGMKVIM